MMDFFYRILICEETSDGYQVTCEISLLMYSYQMLCRKNHINKISVTTFPITSPFPRSLSQFIITGT